MIGDCTFVLGRASQLVRNGRYPQFLKPILRNGGNLRWRRVCTDCLVCCAGSDLGFAGFFGTAGIHTTPGFVNRPGSTQASPLARFAAWVVQDIRTRRLVRAASLSQYRFLAAQKAREGNNIFDRLAEHELRGIASPPACRRPNEIPDVKAPYNPPLLQNAMASAQDFCHC